MTKCQSLTSVYRKKDERTPVQTVDLNTENNRAKQMSEQSTNNMEQTYECQHDFINCCAAYKR